MLFDTLETVPSGEGIIRTMGFADFNCTDGDLCGTAHSAADTGGEFAAAQSLNLSWYPQVRSLEFICLYNITYYLFILNFSNILYILYTCCENKGKWFIPTTDLVNIYASLDIAVQPEWIHECAVIFYAGDYCLFIHILAFSCINGLSIQLCFYHAPVTIVSLY
jgi:hypothetical protein